MPGFPEIPPGPFVLGIPAILVLTLSARFRWVLFLGIVAAAVSGVVAVSRAYRRVAVR
ncbi:hypothetical protein GCM10027598_25110 [Amycolatopsis oliviviridis]|uniref:Uncharacterized protein n=1 Tax=Amycolatopsis oliviviridis TaxID=1471590 RepID=A0ABQ3LI50_9PSEU|nr:hypothetical protein [Amycolatopsis oliviviridis]GHH16774.1 hypothetical protein GCM10017790_32750 [Amycolatopsis oliviviridis]